MNICPSTRLTRRLAMQVLVICRRLTATCLVICCGPLLVQHAAGTEPTIVPRFRLTMGQELIYRVTVVWAAKLDEGEVSRSQITTYTANRHCVVVRQNVDGSWHLVVWNDAERQVVKSGDEEDRELPVGGGASLTYCNVFPDGRYIPDDLLAFQDTLPALFPALPRDTEALKDGWDAVMKQGNGGFVRLTAAREPGTDGTWTFLGNRKSSPLDAIHQSATGEWRFTFDSKRGIVQRSVNEANTVQVFHARQTKATSTTTGTHELREVRQHDENWIKQFAIDADRYFVAAKSALALRERARQDPKNAEALLASASAPIKEVRDGVTLPIFRAQVDAWLMSYAESDKLELEAAKRRGSLLAAPSPEWQTTDLAGKPHALKDYRGKVVVLDFWFRGCGPCIAAMPQVKQLAEDFKNEPVVVLGMSADEDQKDAQFVADKLELTYPILNAKSIREQYQVQTMPTLIVIDQQGIVRHVELDPRHLRDDIGRVVNDLLKQQK
jgi:thiol-disulfide isomerase/thioredoxin